MSSEVSYKGRTPRLMKLPYIKSDPTRISVHIWNRGNDIRPSLEHWAIAKVAGTACLYPSLDGAQADLSRS